MCAVTLRESMETRKSEAHQHLIGCRRQPGKVQLRAVCVCVSVFVKGWNITADGFVKSPKPDGL